MKIGIIDDDASFSTQLKNKIKTSLYFEDAEIVVFNEKFETVVRRYSLDSKKLVEENRYLMLENAKLNEMIYEKRNLLDQLCNLENDLRTVFFQIKKLDENKVEGF